MYARDTAFPISRTAGDSARTLFAHTMGLVGITAAFFAGGAYLGRNLSGGAGLLWFLAAFGCLFGLRAAISRSEQLAVGLLFGFGLLLGLACSPQLAERASTNPQALWQAGGATALFIAGFGAYGYATRRDLARIARVAFFALLALIVFGIVLLFVQIPGGQLIYAILGLVIFAAFTMFDFQRLRNASDVAVAPLLAASIFLDILNVFMLMLSLFGGDRR
jgi:FtsH-binding integral membrane protein